MGYKSLLFSVSVFFISGFVQAEDPESLHSIVVSATRSEQTSVTTPASIEIIDEQEIRQSAAQNIGELLRNRAGIEVHDLFGDGSNTTIGIRGFSESANQNTLIMVDGRRLNNADIGGPALNSISMKNIQRIEIIKGSAGVLFGDQAVGGVINIITRQPETDQATIGVSIGSYQSYKSFFNVDKRLGDRYTLRISGEAFDTENYRDHNQYDKGMLSGMLNYEYQQGRAFIELSRVNSNQETPGALSEAQAAADRKQSVNIGDFTNRETLMQRVGIDHEINDHWDVLIDLTNKEENNPYVVWGSTGYQARQLKSFNPRLSGNYLMNGSELLVTVGMDYEETDFMIESPFTNRSNEQETESLYWQAVIPLNKRLSMTAGARHAQQDNFIIDALTYINGQAFNDTQTVGELGISYKAEPASRIFIRAEQNYRFPKIDEQAYTSPGVILETQTGVSWEMGYEKTFERGWLSINAYQLELEDEIAFDPTATPPAGAFFNGANVNFDPTTHQGIMLDGDYMVTNNLQVSASYTYTDATFDSGIYAGKSVSFVPQHSARVAMNWTPVENTNLRLEALYTGDRYVSGDNANLLPEVDSITVLNLSASHRLQDYHIGFRVNNLSNRKYNDFVTPFGVNPAPERNVRLEVSVQI